MNNPFGNLAFVLCSWMLLNVWKSGGLQFNKWLLRRRSSYLPQRIQSCSLFSRSGGQLLSAISSWGKEHGSISDTMTSLNKQLIEMRLYAASRPENWPIRWQRNLSFISLGSKSGKIMLEAPWLKTGWVQSKHRISQVYFSSKCQKLRRRHECWESELPWRKQKAFYGEASGCASWIHQSH